MKKGLIAIIAIIGLILIGALSIASGQVTIYSQNFDGSWSTTSPPSGWQITDSYDGPQNNDRCDWHRYTYSWYRPPGGSGAYARIYYYGHGYFSYQTDILRSPSINCSGFVNVRLRIDDRWDRYYGSYYHPYIEGSINGGSTWPYQIYEYHGDEAHNDHTFDISDWADGQSNVMIRFRGYGRPWYMNWWCIDNFIVEGNPGQQTPAEVEIVDIFGIPDFITSGVSYTPVGRVRNNGGETANNVAVACSIWTHDGVLDYHSEKTILSLGAYNTQDVTFDDWDVTGYCGEEYTIKVSTDFDDDEPENNYKEKTALVIRVLLAEYYFDQTDDGFTHTTYRCSNDCWEWGAPSKGSARRGGYPGAPPTEPYCWGTKIDNYYPTYSGSRLMSPIIDLPSGSKNLRLEFKHWYYFYYRYAGGNVKLSLDEGPFELIRPVGNYPSSVYYGCLSGEPAYTYYGSGGWRDAIFDYKLETPAEKAQFAFDFGSYHYNSWWWMRCWGWAIDNVKVFVRYPPVAITDIGGIPALAGINCCYTPTVKVRNQWREALMRVDILRHITKPGDTIPEYEGHQEIDELAKDAEQEVTFEEDWCAPSTPNVIYYDSVFAGIAGLYLDTLFRIIEVRVDVGEHEPIEPMDTIYTDTSYRPLARLQALIGCDVPTHTSLTLQDSTAHAIYYSEQDVVLPHGSKEYAFDSLKVDDPGYYTFVLVTQTEGDSIFTNDTLRWDVRALTRGALDVGTEAILMPTKANPGDSIVPKAIVKNYGTVRATNFDVECTIDPDGYSDTKSITGIDPGAVDTVEFAIWVAGDSPEHTITVTTKLTGDENPGNDSKTQKVTGIAEKALPTKFALSAIRPNPFAINTEISYDIPYSTKVSLAVYDITGKLVKNLVNETKETGSYTAIWDAKDVPAGIYFVKLITPEYKATRKIVLTR